MLAKKLSNRPSLYATLAAESSACIYSETLSRQHELLMGPDADLSVTSRPPGCKHTHINTHIHILNQCLSLCFFGEMMTDDTACSPVTLGNPQCSH